MPSQLPSLNALMCCNSLLELSDIMTTKLQYINILPFSAAARKKFEIKYLVIPSSLPRHYLNTPLIFLHQITIFNAIIFILYNLFFKIEIENETELLQ